MALSAFSCTSLIGFLEIEKHHATNSQKFKEILVPSSSSFLFSVHFLFAVVKTTNAATCEHLNSPKIALPDPYALAALNLSSAEANPYTVS